MNESRPDPDRLLDQLRDADARAQRGKLKIFFGASAGVGKTCAMLAAARQQVLQNVDVVIGIIETHGRLETEAMADGIESVPLRRIEHQGRTLQEFDLDAMLARKPAIALVDELAHSNAHGSRHPKRWQDVEELLAAGIDVWTAINVQHLETLNDVVGGITGVTIRETVPDRIFDLADEVVLVDLPPDELLQRLKDGKVYLPQQAERAIQNFFRKGNLIALRELALRRTADRVDDEMRKYRRDQTQTTSTPVWQTQPSLLACIGADTEGERVIRSAARLATQLDLPWHAIHVATLEEADGASPRQQRALNLLKLAETLGAETANLAASDISACIVKYARDHNLARLYLGRSSVNRRAAGYRWPWQTTLAERLAVMAPDLDITQVARSETVRVRAAAPEVREADAITWPSYAKTVVACVLTTLLATPLQSVFELANIVMLFLLTVVLVAVRYGRGPAVLASFLSVALFDYFFVAPRFSFAVSDVQYLLTFAVMLAVGLITGQLTARFRAQATVATQREERVRALYEMSRDLSGALLPAQIEEICQRFIATEFSAGAALYLADDNDVLQTPSAPGMKLDAGIAQWAYENGAAAGVGTGTLPGSPALYLPLQAPMRLRGVLAIESSQPELLQLPDQRRLLDTCARLIGIALERLHYVNVAQLTTVQMESERLRNSLLSAISHDLRTPLSVLVGLAESLFMTAPPPTPEQCKIANTMREESLRMNSLVTNLLDMARLQAGHIRLKREWQPIEEVIGSSLDAMHAQLADRIITTRLQADLPLLEFDAVLIERVLCNLLENTAKFAPAGSHVEIGASLQPAEDNPRFVEVWVADDGPGLPAGKEDAIFEKFARGQKESATPGVGLGLAICRAIIEAHGGTIHGENRRDAAHGARFSFTLPCGLAPTISEPAPA